MYLNYLRCIQQILSDLVVSIVYWTIWFVGSNPAVLQVNFFFFKTEETFTVMITNISSLKYHLSVT